MISELITLSSRQPETSATVEALRSILEDVLLDRKYTKYDEFIEVVDAKWNTYLESIAKATMKSSKSASTLKKLGTLRD